MQLPELKTIELKNDTEARKRKFIFDATCLCLAMECVPFIKMKDALKTIEGSIFNSIQ